MSTKLRKKPVAEEKTKMKLFEYVKRDLVGRISINEACRCGHLITEHHDLVPNLPDEAKGCGRCAVSEECLCERFTFKCFIYKEKTT